MDNNLDTNLDTNMGFFQKLKNSTYNFKAYKVFLAQSTGKAVLYIFLLCLIFTSIANVKTLIVANSQLNSLESSINKNFPTMEITKGKLSVKAEQPIKYIDNDFIFIIDTSGKADTSQLGNYPKGLLVTEDEIIYKENDYKAETIRMSQIQNMTLSADTITHFIKLCKTIGFALIIIFAPLYSFVRKLIGAVIILGLGGLALSAIMDIKLTYGECVKLGLYAITVPYLVNTLLYLIGLSIPGFILIYYILGLIYLGFAIKEIGTFPSRQDNIIG
ncbi:DUF1189 domain-containing protein [Inconstantimicrobium mannanitabidum]|uniref:Uncharacterized protein n=1 Tax=Inconstantimicrobium mannanitabidum TaxID=1604901 RepID=A0ACB5REI6_9CLOT|nr:DUF1189 domain-containing protein [Clostridium sp. TW13]GKX67299.1 hypothetical protein rsdtw13_25570 [Clostridium sp. TW13]